jgi:helix-turn-helix protein
MSENEPFVDADIGAKFLSVTRRRLLELARYGEIPGHPIGSGRRRTWRFRLSELAEAIALEKPTPVTHRQDIIDLGSPRQPNRRKQ